MAQTVGYANAFTAGEIGENAWERSDLQQHAQGVARADNMVGLVTGPLASRGGFLDRGASINEAFPSRLTPFARTAGDALFLEIGHEQTRVWTPGGTPVMKAGVPYVFPTPWEASDLERLWFKNINDVIYVTGRQGVRTCVLMRHADDDWSWAPFEFRDGPWLNENPDGPTLTLTPSGGFLEVTASAAVFSPSDVENQIRYREGDGNPGLETWTAGTDYAAGVYVQFDGRIYQRADALGTAKSGTTPPLHQSGVLSDGKLSWAFRHDGAGVMRVTVYHSPTHVTCAGVRGGPAVTTTAYWAKNAFSAVEGYPSAIAEEREERLVFASSVRQPGKVAMTRTAGFGPQYGDFKPGLGTGRVVDDDAVTLDVGGGGRLIWMLSASALVAGCTDGEYLLSGSRLEDPILPTTRRAPMVSAFGNADVAPLLVQGPPPVILHVLRSRRVLRETRISPDLSVESRELSVLPHHIFDRGVAEMAFQQPDNIVWLRLDDGGLAAMTYHLEHQVVGATRQPLPGGWTVESLAVAPNANADDVVMLVVTRLKNGVRQRRVWRGTARRDGVFMDGAGLYEGAPTTEVSGLGHLEGETVVILADGARVADQVVTGGKIVLSVAAGRVLVGLKMRRFMESLPLDMEGVGSTNARTIKPTHATVIVTAADCLVGTDEPDSAERVQGRAASELAAPVGKRLRARVSLGGGAGRDRRLVIESDAPFDLMLHAWRLEAETTK